MTLRYLRSRVEHCVRCFSAGRDVDSEVMLGGWAVCRRCRDWMRTGQVVEQELYREMGPQARVVRVSMVVDSLQGDEAQVQFASPDVKLGGDVEWLMLDAFKRVFEPLPYVEAAS